MKKIGLMAAAMAVTCTSAFADSVVQMSAMTSFGGDGWVAPNETTNLGTGSLERGLAYNKATGNIVFVSRTGGLNVRVLNGTTGTFINTLGVGGVTGGTFTGNMIGAGDDGSIYLANLATSTTAAFKVYKWTSEAPAVDPTNVFNLATGLARVGDSFDVMGSGVGTRIIASGTGTTGFTELTDNGSGFTHSNKVVGASGAFRLGITYAGNNTAYGKQTTSPLTRAQIDPVQLLGTNTMTANGEMALDFTNINGLDLLATLDANSSIVRIYDMTNPLAPVLRDSLTTTSGTLTGNGNGVGQIRWGMESGGSATLYAMSANQGIQAFNITVVPEPGTVLGVLAGLGLLVARRRKA